MEYMSITENINQSDIKLTQLAYFDMKLGIAQKMMNYLVK